MRLFGCVLIACVVAAIWLLTQLPTPAGNYEHPHTTAVPTLTVTVPALPAKQDTVPEGSRFGAYVYRNGEWIGPVHSGDDTGHGA